MKNKYESQRGAILVESALVVGAIFLMLFGTVYLAIIGFDQMSADGASYEVAHQTSVGASAPPAATHSAFPNIPQAQITTAPLSAPSPTIGIDYQYNGTAAEQANAAFDRHGGVSMVQAEQVQGQASKTSARILGQPIAVSGSMIEPVWLENGLHFNAADTNNYGGAADSASFQGSVFTQGENAPPYFVGFNYMAHCIGASDSGSGIPWGWQSTGAQCNSYTYTPLGVAEFLDYQNWCSASPPSNGQAPPCTIATPGAAGSTQADSTFANASCHQRVYATIAKFFADPKNATLLDIYTNQGGYNGAGPFFYYYNHPSWSLGVWAGYDSTLGSEGGTPDGPTDQAIRKAYNWDGADVVGTPPPNGPLQDPLYPDRGC